MPAGKSLYLFNCPNCLMQYTQNIGVNCIGVSSLDDLTQLGIPIIISTWKQDSSVLWIENIKRIRRKGFANPIIVTSFEKEDIISRVDKDGLHLRFIRLPFNELELMNQFEKAVTINPHDINILRQKLYRDYINTTLPELKHGKKLEFANQLFVPLRAALTLDGSDEKKQKLIKEILGEGITDFWFSNEITELKECIYYLLPENQSEEDLKSLFAQTETIITSLSNNSKDITFTNCIDAIDSCNRYLIKLGL
jgi:hypothetical protein